MPRGGDNHGGSRKRTATKGADSDESLPAFPVYRPQPVAGPSAALFDAAPIGYVVLDAEDVIVRANAELGRMLKLEPAVLACMDFTGFVAADSLEDFRGFRLRGGERTELHLHTATGTPFPVRLHRVEACEGGQALLAISDLSELEQARARLHEHELELRVARRQLERSGRREQDYLQVADVIMVGLNAAGEITLLNRKGCELLGCEEYQVLRRNWFNEFLPADERDLTREMFEQAVADNVPLPEFVTSKVVTRDGLARQVRWHTVTLRDVHGRVEGVLASGVDITDQLRTEQRLQQSQAALVNTRQKLDLYEGVMVAVVENSPDAVLTFSPEGMIQTANQAALHLFGRGEHDLVGQHVSILVPPPQHPQHDDSLAGSLRGGIGRLVGEHREILAMRSSGECFPAHLSVGDISDRVNRVYTGVLRDLTREKQLQKQIQEQEALATLGRMAAVVAHEVRNPLAGISGVIQVFRDRLAADAPERDVLGDVLKRVDALVETIQDLLLYARPRDLRLTPVRMSELLSQTARLVAEDPRFQRIEIRVPDSDVRLRLDADYFREALLNLLINAAQAMNGMGEIRACIEDAGERIHVRITDNGPGIHPDVREKVFEAFFTTKGRGTGLGLSLVKNVVERHGGQVAIDCPDCGGTVVTLSLPAGTRVTTRIG